MYFKKLELLGFKSFADKTTLNFEPGITAVVGPNGCGKSNIFDAMRWVLGEQSVKALRGSKMEDVIFNGTESIPALGYAEVSLTFSNETKALPIEYDEVTITRRLFRSGESEYLINKTQVRLKDILELFMGTGIGAESYSLIEQGKIDLILSSRPEDRRLVFDEAAGISKYKSQKKETVRKLEDTDANLLRINDIITEVKRQINSLERQAAKARRYQEVFDKLKDLEACLAATQIKQYQEELTKLNANLSNLINQEAQNTHMINQLNNEFINQGQGLAQMETGLANLKQETGQLENTIQRDSQQVSFNQERIIELTSRLEILKAQEREFLEKISQDEVKINNFKAGLECLNKELNDKKQQQDICTKQLEEVTAAITQAQASIKEAKARVLEFVSLEAAQNNQIQDSTSQLNQAIARKKRLDIERIKIEEEFALAKEKLSSANLSKEAAFSKLNNCRAEKQKLIDLQNKIVREKEQLQSELIRLENEKSGYASQKEFLTNLKLKYENIAESANAILLLDSLSDKDLDGIIIKVKEVSKVGAPEEQLPGAKYRIKGIAKPISLDPAQTISKLEALSIVIEQLSQGLKQKLRLADEFKLKLGDSDDALRQSEIECNTQNTNLENIEQNYKKIEDESGIIMSECKETDQELNILKDRERILKEGLSKVKEDSQKNQQAIEQWLEDIAQKNASRETVLIAITQLATEISACQEKVRTSQDTYRIYEEAYISDKSGLKICLQEVASSGERIQGLKDSLEKLKSDIDSAKRQKTEKEKEIGLAQGAFLAAKNNFKDLQSNIEDYKNSLNTAKAKTYELQMRIQELNFSQSSISERLSQVYKIKPEELNLFYKSDFSPQESSQEIEQLKEKLASYGQVNLVAIDEFAELKERYDFLNSQHEDLVKSKEALHEAILKINRTTKKIFMDTFKMLTVEFKNYFRLLFGGGDAQLFLIDEEDVLESGIEIICRPPGKKLQNVLLLSGGEKALSAIALLFAIFKVKPSPFCVLDEIDAALDEANVDRFSRMLVDFTKQSQFIVITHNKKTISTANIMYGITMEKAGISKIVSVKLAESDSDKAVRLQNEKPEDNRPRRNFKPQEPASLKTDLAK